MTTVGLVGAGPWAARFHAPMLAGATSVRLGPLWARRRDAADELAARFGTVAVDSFDELLARCDAVAFAVPPDVQADLAVRAAAAGRHLLLEKPLALTLADAERLAAAADAHGVRSLVVLTLRFRTEVRDLLAALAGETVHYVRGSYLGPGGLPGSPFASPWRSEPGAGLLDVGPHTVDLMEAVAGPVVEVRGVDRGGVTVAETRHASGAAGQLAVSITTASGPGGVFLDVVTESGFAALPTGGGDEAAVWRAITDELARTVETGEPHLLDVHHGVRLQRVLDAITRSVATGRPVTL